MSHHDDRNDSSETFMPLLDAYLNDFFNAKSHAAQTIHPSYERLWLELQRVSLNGGKRLRPRMLLLAYNSFGGRDAPAVIPAAAALELLHSSLLIHDDIMDRESIRRGEPNVSGMYEMAYYNAISATERRHYSDGAALMGGDLLLASATQLIHSCQLPSSSVQPAAALFERIVFEVAGGQLLDSEASVFDDLNVSALTIARYKTASYSFVGPLLIGAALAGFIDVDHQLETFAYRLGMAFQLNDDLISTFGNERVTGKSTDSDLREGKQTLLVEHFLQYSDDESRQIFTTLFGSQTMHVEDVETVKRLIEQSGAVEAIEKRIDELCRGARTALAKLNLPSAAENNFDQLIAASINRVS